MTLVKVGCDRCEKQRDFSEGLAGVRETCECGGTFEVPSWTEIQRRKGLTQEDLNPEFLIPARVRAGELPPQHCICCGGSGDELIPLKVVCSESYLEGGDRGTLLTSLLVLIGFCFSFFWFVLLWRPQRAEVYGHDLVVGTPVLMCAGCKAAQTFSTAPSWMMRFQLPIILLAVGSFFLDGRLTILFLILAGANQIRETVFAKRTQRQLFAIVNSVDGYAPLLRKFKEARFNL